MVAAAELLQLFQFFPGKHAPHRVVGVTHDKDRHVFVACFFHRLEIHLIKPVCLLERHFPDTGVRFLRKAADMGVHRGVQHDVTPGHPAGQICSRHDAGHKNNPIPLHFTVILLPVMPADHLIHFIIDIGKSKCSFINPGFQRLSDRTRNPKIHVSHPHRDVFASLVVPLLGADSSPIYNFVKVHH